MKSRSLATLALCATFSCVSSCKKGGEQVESDSEAQFIPIAIGAGYGIALSTEAAVVALAAGGIVVMDCTRPARAGEIRFFCEGSMKFGKTTMDLIADSTRNLVSALRWTHANVASHLSDLSKSASPMVLKSAVAGTASRQSIESAAVSPKIKSDSGQRNFVSSVKAAITFADSSKTKCDYIAQYEARIVPNGYKGGWMGGTATRFIARAPSAESAEAMALAACDFFAGSEGLYKIAPGFRRTGGGFSNNNGCRKPLSVDGFKAKYRTAEMSCPSVRVCTSEQACADYPIK